MDIFIIAMVATMAALLLCVLISSIADHRRTTKFLNEVKKYNQDYVSKYDHEN